MLNKFKNGGFFNRQRADDINGTYQGKINQLPSSFVRSASCDKLKQGTSLTNIHTQRTQNTQKSMATSRNKITSQLYQKMLGDKINSNQKNNISTQILKDKLFKTNNNNKQIKQKRKSSTTLRQRLLNTNNNNNNQHKKSTFKQQISAKQQQDIRQCTFKPKINQYKGSKRTLQQFIDNQIQYEKHKQDKVQQLRDMLKTNLQKQNTFKPNITKRNNSIMNRNQHHNYNSIQNQTKGNSKIYERLYHQSKDRQEKLNNAVQQQMDKIIKQANRISTANRISSISRPSKASLYKQGSQQIIASQKSYSTIKQTQNHQYHGFDNQSNTKEAHQNHQYESTQNSGPNQFRLKLNQQIDRNRPNNIMKDIKSSIIPTLTDRSYQTNNSRRNSKGLNLTNQFSKNQSYEKRSQSPANFSNFNSIHANMKKKNQEIVINKFLRQINTILDKLMISTPKITYMEMNSILSQMKFISYSHQNYSVASISQNLNSNGYCQANSYDFIPSAALQQRKYLYEIWEMLQGDATGNISLISLLKIIFAVLGCHQCSLVSQALNKKILVNLQEGKRSGTHNSYQNLILTQKDSKNLKARFQSFYTNRLKQGPQCDKSQPQYSFKPQISKTSVQMAQKYRMRVIDQSEKLLDEKLIEFKVPENGQISHADLLMLDEKRKQLRLKLQREQQQLKKKIQQDQAMGLYNCRNGYFPNEQESSINHTNEPSECSSKPQTSRNQSNNTSKFIQLYQQGKYNKHKRDKSEDEVKAEKWQKQLTFKPQINQYNALKQRQNFQKANNLSNMLNNVPDFDKAVFRMYEGRKMKSNPFNQNKQNNFQNLSQENVINYNSKGITQDLLSKYASQQSMGSHENYYHNPSFIKPQIQFSSDNYQRPLIYLNINMEGTQSTKVPVYKSDNLKTIAQKVKIMMGINQNDYGQNQSLEDLLRDQVQDALSKAKSQNYNYN